MSKLPTIHHPISQRNKQNSPKSNLYFSTPSHSPFSSPANAIPSTRFDNLTAGPSNTLVPKSAKKTNTLPNTTNPTNQVTVLSNGLEIPNVPRTPQASTSLLFGVARLNSDPRTRCCKRFNTKCWKIYRQKLTRPAY